MTPFFGKTKPSEFLQAMVDGLREINPETQHVSMWSLGYVDHRNICYGCAATWTLQKLADRKLAPVEVLSLNALAGPLPLNGTDPKRIIEFEQAMDGARSGYLTMLAVFCELSGSELARWDRQWEMLTNNYTEAFPKVELAIKDMQEAGL